MPFRVRLFVCAWLCMSLCALRRNNRLTISCQVLVSWSGMTSLIQIYKFEYIQDGSLTPIIAVTQSWSLEIWCLSHTCTQYRIVLYAVPYSTQYRIVGRYVRILTNIDQILTKKLKKIQKHVFFQKGMWKKKAPAALVSVANMAWGYQYWLNIDKYWLLLNY